MDKETKYSLIFLVATIVVVAIILPYASEHPDGLEKVAENLGFIETATEVYTASPMPDYVAFDLKGYMGGFLSLIVGAGLVLGLGLFFGYIMKKKETNKN